MNNVFDALASDTRREILAHLSRDELSAGEIAARFAMSKPAISKHLRILEGAGLVTAEKRGQFVWYAIAHEQISTAIAHFLETVEPGVLEADKPPRPGTMPPRERRGSRLDRQRDRA